MNHINVYSQKKNTNGWWIFYKQMKIKMRIQMASFKMLNY